MKKKIILFLLLFLVPSFVFAEEIKEKNNTIFIKSNGITESTNEFVHKARKIDDGYLSVKSWSNDWSNTTRDRLAHLYVKKMDNDGNLVWEKEFTDRGEWVRTEQTGIYLGKDNDVFISNHELIVRVDLSTGELLKQTTDIGCYKIVEYGQDLMCIGSAVFYQPYIKWKKNNSLYVIDKDLKLIKEISFDDKGEYLLSATVENETIYALTFTRVSGKYTYYLKTINSSFEEINIMTLDDELSDSGSINLEKIGNDFYYVAQTLKKNR